MGKQLPGMSSPPASNTGGFGQNLGQIGQNLGQLGQLGRQQLGTRFGRFG
jgi:hypothetical protein